MKAPRKHPTEMTPGARNSLAYRLRHQVTQLDDRDRLWLATYSALFVPRGGVALESEAERMAAVATAQGDATPTSPPSTSTPIEEVRKVTEADAGPVADEQMTAARRERDRWLARNAEAPAVVAWLRDNPPPAEWTRTPLEWAYTEGPDWNELDDGGGETPVVPAESPAPKLTPAEIAERFAAAEGDPDLTEEKAVAVVQTTLGGLDKEAIADLVGGSALGWLMTQRAIMVATGNGDRAIPALLIKGLVVPCIKGAVRRRLPDDLGALEDPIAIGGVVYSWTTAKAALARISPEERAAAIARLQDGSGPLAPPPPSASKPSASTPPTADEEEKPRARMATPAEVEEELVKARARWADDAEGEGDE